MAELSEADRALAELLACLGTLGYDFVAPTPATHARIVARPGKDSAEDLRDVFGWSLRFRPELLPDDLRALLESGGALVMEGDWRRSLVRASRVGGLLFLHGAYPTDQADSVFLGPDTYRFADFVAAELARIGAVTRIVDMGAGAGAGGILAGRARPGATVTLVDSNEKALRLARINAAAAGIAVETIVADRLEAVPGAIDLVIANPPYMMDAGGPVYRDGGAMHGAGLSHAWALAAARRLAPGGHMLLYTGSAIVRGEDELRAALERDLPRLGCTLSYREIDPDVFGEQLALPAYRDVERIAAIGAVIARAGG